MSADASSGKVAWLNRAIFSEFGAERDGVGISLVCPNDWPSSFVLFFYDYLVDLDFGVGRVDEESTECHVIWSVELIYSTTRPNVECGSGTLLQRGLLQVICCESVSAVEDVVVNGGVAVAADRVDSVGKMGLLSMSSALNCFAFLPAVMRVCWVIFEYCN
jgi:hypothetical protein